MRIRSDRRQDSRGYAQGQVDRPDLGTPQLERSDHEKRYLQGCREDDDADLIDASREPAVGLVSLAAKSPRLDQNTPRQKPGRRFRAAFATLLGIAALTLIRIAADDRGPDLDAGLGSNPRSFAHCDVPTGY